MTYNTLVKRIFFWLIKNLLFTLHDNWKQTWKLFMYSNYPLIYLKNIYKKSHVCKRFDVFLHWYPPFQPPTGADNLWELVSVSRGMDDSLLSQRYKRGIMHVKHLTKFKAVSSQRSSHSNTVQKVFHALYEYILCTWKLFFANLLFRRQVAKNCILLQHQVILAL